MYPETGDTAARWLEKTLGQKFTRTVPIGIGATNEFIAEVCALAGLPVPPVPADSRMPWWSQSVDSTYLTGKRVFIFGDGTHAVAAARVASQELGFEVVGLGCYNREFARDIREAAKLYGVEPLITDDYLAVEEAIAAANCELVLGTQMERHIAKRLRIPCAVISAPVHVQDFPARHSPQMGFEGANVLFDTWVHPLVMGLEEHLLTMFRDDFEFNDAAGASHLGGHGAAAPATPCRYRTWARATRRTRVHGPKRWTRHHADPRPLQYREGGGCPLRLDPRRRARTAQDPVLRPRQGPSQYRGLCRRQGPVGDHARHAVRRQGPSCALTPPSPRRSTSPS